jgi:hypothetical protein
MIARIYCVIAICVGFGNAFDLVSEVNNWNLDVTGLLSLTWVPISAVAAVLFCCAEEKLPMISPLVYIAYVLTNFLCTPGDNMFKRTMDAGTIGGIAFGLIYALLNGWLLYQLRVKRTQQAET